MRTQSLVALLLPLAIGLAGCESMTVSECKVADWSRVGYTDGSRGESESRIANYTEDCGKAGIVPNAKAYRRGWDSGILQFCTPANAWREGTQGHTSKEDVCRGQPGANTYARYFQAGMRLHRTKEQMQRNSSETARLQKRLEASKSDDERKELRSDLRHIDRDQARLRHLLEEQQMSAP
jgi:hypothetical protein